MPNRIIRESSRWSHSLAKLSNAAARAWWSLNTVFDDFGRYYGSEDALYSAAFPIGAREMTQKVFSRALRELVAVDCIRFYELDGRRYVYVPSWDKHQTRRAKDSRFPAPANICSQMPANAPVIEDVIGDVIGDENTTCAPRSAEAGPDGFEAFWTAYPKDRRRGKFEARQAWTRLRLTSEQIAQLMRSLDAWVRSHDWQKSGGRFIPWPQKFLNRRRWEETPDASSGSDLADALPPLELS